MSSDGILLIGHGTRSERGTREFLALSERLSERVDPVPVEPCFLELREPSLASGWKALVGRGARHIHAAPVLLFAAGHAKRDIPRALAECAADSPQVTYACAAPFSCHPRLLALSERRMQEALRRVGAWRPERTALVLVGRGSLDDEATNDMLRMSALRGRQHPLAQVRTAFVAMAGPPITRVLEEVAADRAVETVVVQPHLLFDGDLFARVQQLTCRMAARCPHKQWVATGYLGPDPEVAAILAERCLGGDQSGLASGPPAAGLVRGAIGGDPKLSEAWD